MTEGKSYFITEADILKAVEYVRANQPCKSNDVAAHIHRTKNSTRQMLNRNSRFRAEILDNSNILFWLAEEYGPYDVRYMNGVIHHRQAGAGKGKPHAFVPETISLFALQPWAIRRDVIPDRGYTLQSPRMQAND